ncbi:MAG: histidine phosphatase family protein [Oscillospiraceae bacterium]|jgi:broad specificity phosphatase PhoE|nr:histidine phosphatase family protein [Oscillospiraceae bacterium]
MKIYALRHGQTDWNAANRIQGRTDIPLNEAGRKQAAEAAAAISGSVDAVISSQLVRAVETAAIIAEAKGLSRDDIIIDERLMERNFGDYEGLPVSSVDVFALRRYTDNLPIPNGEAMGDVVERVFECLDELLPSLAGKNVLIVAHGHVMRPISWYFEGLPEIGREVNIETHNCKLWCFDYDCKLRSNVI